MTVVDSTARVAPGAEIGTDVSIGPYCIIGANAVIGDGCQLLSHVNIAGRTSVGARTIIYPFASLGTPPQSTGYKGEPTRLVVGADCDIREGVTMNLGTAQGGGVTEVGAHGFFMVNSHVGHDCRVGNHVVFANSATLGGHCIVGDHVFIGGLAAVHQFCRIGISAIIAGVAGIRSDVIPYSMALGAPGRLVGLNVVGMKRRGLNRDVIRTVHNAYRMLFFGEEVFARRLEQVEATYGQEPVVAEIIAFIRADTNRSLCQPGSHHAD